MRQPMTAPIPLLFSLAGMWGPLHSLACSPNFSLRSCSDVLDGPAAAAFLQLPLSPSSFPLLSSHLSPSLPCPLSLQHADPAPCARIQPRRAHAPAAPCATPARKPTGRRPASATQQRSSRPCAVPRRRAVRAPWPHSAKREQRAATAPAPYASNRAGPCIDESKRHETVDRLPRH